MFKKQAHQAQLQLQCQIPDSPFPWLLTSLSSGDIFKLKFGLDQTSHS